MSALPPGRSLAELALGEYTARRDLALRKVDARELTADQAEAHLRPWAALALRCGVDPAQLHDDVRILRDEIAARHQLRPQIASTLVADDLCPRPAIVAAVTQARDAMIARGIAEPTETRGLRSMALVTLAVAIGAPSTSLHSTGRKAA